MLSYEELVISANTSFITCFSNNDDGLTTFTWIMNVDNHGSIVQLHALRPSDPVALTTAMDTLD